MMVSEGLILDNIIGHSSLNPYSYGWWSLRVLNDNIDAISEVLILILMDDGLWVKLLESLVEEPFES